MPPCLVFDFNDPRIRIESNFSRKAIFDRLLGDRLGRRRRKHTLNGPTVVVYGLRRGGVKHRIAVEQRQLDENGARLIRATAAHRPENALALATAQIGSDPYARLQTHHERRYAIRDGDASAACALMRQGRAGMGSALQLPSFVCFRRLC